MGVTTHTSLRSIKDTNIISISYPCSSTQETEDGTMTTNFAIIIFKKSFIFTLNAEGKLNILAIFFF